MSAFHYYTAGFGLLPETTHRGIHMAFVLGLIFLVFGAAKTRSPEPLPASAASPLGIPLYDWLLALAAVISSLYVPWIFHDLQFRVGNPETIDWVMGTLLIIVHARGDAPRRRPGAADHRHRPHGLRTLGTYRSQAFSSIPATPGRASSITST